MESALDNDIDRVVKVYSGDTDVLNISVCATSGQRAEIIADSTDQLLLIIQRAMPDYNVQQFRAVLMGDEELDVMANLEENGVDDGARLTVVVEICDLAGMWVASVSSRSVGGCNDIIDYGTRSILCLRQDGTFWSFVDEVTVTLPMSC